MCNKVSFFKTTGIPGYTGLVYLCGTIYPGLRDTSISGLFCGKFGGIVESGDLAIQGRGRGVWHGRCVVCPPLTFFRFWVFYSRLSHFSYFPFLASHIFSIFAFFKELFKVLVVYRFYHYITWGLQ